MKGFLLLADGFEESEAIITIDLLRRSKIQIDLVSVMTQKEVISAHKLLIKTDFLLSQIHYQDYDFLVLPGGEAVFNVLKDLLVVEEIIRFFMLKQRLVAAICAAPILLGQYQFLKGKKYVCFKGCEQSEFAGFFQKDANVVKDQNLITAKSMYYTIDFALTIIETLLGQKHAVEVKKQIQSL